MKNVSIIGIGIGNLDFTHKKSIDLISNSDCLIGAKRMLSDFIYLNKDTFESSKAEDIYEYISKDNIHKNFGVLVSGDTGFYSLSKKLTEILEQDESIKVENIPAIGSLQYFCSKLNLSWDSIKFVSAHGRNLNIISNIMFNKKTFMLTGGELKPKNICKLLVDKGLGNLQVSVGENLSYNNERIIEDKSSSIANMDFDSLAVMIIHNDNAIEIDSGFRSIRDDEFITGHAPMTKSEVRTISIGKLNLKSDSIVYDIGAGTGSVSIETALKLSGGTLYAIEKNKGAIDLIKENIEKFKVYNIEIIEGVAPEGLDNLPKPDSVFIGGSSGNMDAIFDCLLKKSPHVNIVINTITLQSLNEALEAMEKYKFEDVEIVNVSISKSKKISRYDMMMGQNPIYIISGKGSGLY
ncbi:precorrin-6Y C5,15-methyltransferase (decarboxylating) [Sedimentibacter acidaminivorans]|uniref:Precorrin-6Y C5,15-methyltransferase (Decarboxylating) n=1 Tax=Sedimentibacter acidaminivorans TaxID=913099 RepID=A0ABS4GBJ9_9FIRM|nr:precorrin-6y C5,15-methyltransferase (decarboxylating) subunit CbiE [Sedimentibacter acidaminivorans]MBP1925069.1 precorrin-6Y C5,15-methyltransferase (decarboxylating) [Sedimentibacter acidaminivorans]